MISTLVIQIKAIQINNAALDISNSRQIQTEVLLQVSRCWADDFNFSDTDQHISIQARPGQARPIQINNAGQGWTNKQKLK